MLRSGKRERFGWGRENRGHGHEVAHGPFLFMMKGWKNTAVVDKGFKA